MIEETQQDDVQELHLVVFKLGNEEFAVDINSIREIIRYPTITRVPNTPDYVIGVLNLRGQITTVMTLRRRFRMEDADMTDDTRILIANMGSEYIGIVVDGVSEVLKVESDKMVSGDDLGSSTYGQYVSGMIKIDERLIILLDLVRTFKNQ